MSNLNYEATDEVLEDYSPVPPATYMAAITESELKDNAKGTGNFIALTFKIMDGEYKGRILWANITYSHSNNQAQQIGRKELNTLMAACGLASIQDTTQLHGVAMLIDVKIKQEKDRDPQNEVKNYYSVDDNASKPKAAKSDKKSKKEKPAKKGKKGKKDATPSWAK